MDIIYHNSRLVLEGRDSLVLIDHKGGANIEAAEARIVDFFLDSNTADLAFCRTFLEYRAAYQKGSDGVIRVIAAIPDWQDQIKVPFLDQVSSILRHSYFTDEPSAEEIDVWIAKSFSDKTVKLAMLSGPKRQISIALMRKENDLVTVASES